MGIPTAIKPSTTLPKLMTKLGTSPSTAKSVGQSLQKLEFALDPQYDGVVSLEKALTASASQYFKALVQAEGMEATIEAQNKFLDMMQTETMKEAIANLSDGMENLLGIASSEITMAIFKTAMDWFNKYVALIEGFKERDKTDLFEAFFSTYMV